ncbi:unnamed protein product, partial [Rotaria sp. Silwood1]
MKSLVLSGSSLLSLNILSSIVDLENIQYLEVADIDQLLPDELDHFIAHTPCVTRFSMKFDPLFIIPSQISLERLEICIASKQMIIDVIDRFNGLDNLDIFFDDEDLDDN